MIFGRSFLLASNGFIVFIARTGPAWSFLCRLALEVEIIIVIALRGGRDFFFRTGVSSSSTISGLKISPHLRHWTVLAEEFLIGTVASHSGQIHFGDMVRVSSRKFEEGARVWTVIASRNRKPLRFNVHSQPSLMEAIRLCVLLNMRFN